jgi:hypothetical protein
LKEFNLYDGKNGVPGETELRGMKTGIDLRERREGPEPFFVGQFGSEPVIPCW